MNVFVASSVVLLILMVTISYHLLNTIEQIEDDLLSYKKRLLLIEKTISDDIEKMKEGLKL